MENKVTDKKAENFNVLKEFKKLISPHSNKIKDPSSYEYHFQKILKKISRMRMT